MDPLQHQKLSNGVLQWCQLSSFVLPAPKGMRYIITPIGSVHQSQALTHKEPASSQLCHESV